MEISAANKYRLAIGAATVVNTAVAEKAFDSRGIALYHAISGTAALAASALVPEVAENEEQEYTYSDAALTFAGAVIGGTVLSGVFKGIGTLLSKEAEDEADAEEIASVIEEVTGLTPED
ncbi:hypothetical protein HWC35_gp098 [Vibrio phage USC-1]|uniref:Uncharacterized protein n=2 Tax=Aphroditevirus USC1 TaxID=2846605 RepID=A0A514A2P6_9CAUD|nr:hypothetical protein HWC35_gp098 [Vibrio phage USC-1]QCW23236.1 hypothetical protein [Vibrio phage 5 TSL-2019]QDH47492.1 hypothetical protein [Vibrio phage USC-1]